MSKPNFYVAISKEYRDIGIASVVGLLKKDITDFYKEYAGHEIRICDGAEMRKLMLATQPPLPSDEEAPRADTGSPQERGQPDIEDLSKVMI